MSPRVTKFIALSLAIGIIAVGLVQSPAPVLASTTSSSCSNTMGRYYTPLVPFFNTNTRQITLVDPKTYHVVQVIADHIDNADLLSNLSSWSPSCRYFVFSVAGTNKVNVYLWDNQAHQQIGPYQFVPYEYIPAYDLSAVHWSPGEQYLIVENNQGERLWNVATNQQFQLNDLGIGYNWVGYVWDMTHNQVLTSYQGNVVAYDLNTGNAKHAYPTPFNNGGVTYFEVSADGGSVRLWDPYIDKWSITYDSNSGAILDVHAIADLPADQLQFSPDHRFLVVGGITIDIYDTQAISSNGYGWSPVASFETGYFIWHFVDSKTLELDSTHTKKKQLIDLATGRVR